MEWGPIFRYTYNDAMLYLQVALYGIYNDKVIYTLLLLDHGERQAQHSFYL